MPDRPIITRVCNELTGRDFEVSTILVKGSPTSVAFEIPSGSQYDFGYCEHRPAVEYMRNAHLKSISESYVYVGRV